MTYVPLDRRFEPLPDDEAERTVDWSAFVSASGRGWPDLIQDPLVVILGPGGIGKTTEMMHQAHSLRASGKVAVFVRLEDLVQQTFEDALAKEDDAAFCSWDPAHSEAIFLLDAVNEAKLNAPNALRSALRTFAKAVAHGAGKVRVILSCRPSDWQYRADPATIRDALSGLTPNTRPTPAAGGLTAYDYSVHADTLGTAPPSATTEVVPVTTVRLAPLTENQIRQLTVHHKVANANAFIAALSRTGGLFLAGRPRDLEWLAEQWNREQRFGSLWEMLDRNVWAKLQERNPALGDRDRLTPERALHAAERLAGATILCRESLIRIPDPHLDPSVDHPALDPAEVLDKWAPADIAALLRRPLFEEAPGGRVRFHHGSVSIR